MKRLFPIFFLLIYVSVLLRPAYIWLDYSMHKDYIARVLCENKNKPALHCNGKCQLMKRLKKTAEENPLSHAPLISFEVFMPHFSQDLLMLQPNQNGIEVRIIAHYLLPGSSSHLRSVFRPPQV
jgi:hypothetical protein